MAVSSSTLRCTVCLDDLSSACGRTMVKLKCSHEFHLDCIGSAFNFRGKMECPNCRSVEKGEWRRFGRSVGRRNQRTTGMDGQRLIPMVTPRNSFISVYYAPSPASLPPAFHGIERCFPISWTGMPKPCTEGADTKTRLFAGASFSYHPSPLSMPYSIPGARFFYGYAGRYPIGSLHHPLFVPRPWIAGAHFIEPYTQQFTYNHSHPQNSSDASISFAHQDGLPGRIATMTSAGTAMLNDPTSWYSALAPEQMVNFFPVHPVQLASEFNLQIVIPFPGLLHYAEIQSIEIHLSGEDPSLGVQD